MVLKESYMKKYIFPMVAIVLLTIAYNFASTTIDKTYVTLANQNAVEQVKDIDGPYQNVAIYEKTRNSFHTIIFVAWVLGVGYFTFNVGKNVYKDIKIS